MLCRLSIYAVAATFLLLPARLFAGGPPWLCLPIDGVTPDNAKACEQLLTAKLNDQLWPHARDRGIKIHQNANQSYVTFDMGKDVTLHDVEAALKNSGFSVPRDRLHVFGHVILEIDPRKTPHAELLAAIEALDHVSVAKLERTNNLLEITVDMPYPVENRYRPEEEFVTFKTFHRHDLASDQSTRSEPPATAQKLPGYNTFRDTLAKHNASLKDIRWSMNHGCRGLGCVAAPDATALSQAKQSN